MNHGKAIHDEKFNTFREWLRKKGFPKTKLILAEFRETGRGMMATKDIEAHELIMSVPERFLITPHHLHKIYVAALSLYPSVITPHQLLTLHLVLQRSLGSRSDWAPYIQMLPVDFSTMPMMYKKNLLALLPGFIQDEVKTQQKKLRTDFKAINIFLKANPFLNPTGTTITFKDFTCAWLCVNTRCVYLDIGSSHCDTTNIGCGSITVNVALAPMFDFLNHSPRAKITSTFNPTTRSLEIRTLVPYARGTQVFINYGPHDNGFLLREYGFVVPLNSYNFYLLDEDVEALTGWAERRKILESKGFWGDYSIRPGEISFRLLCALRMCKLRNLHEKLQIEAWEAVTRGERCWIDRGHETEVWQCVCDLCQGIIINAEEVERELGSTNAVLHIEAMFVRQIWVEMKGIAEKCCKEATEKIKELEIENGTE